MTTGYKSTGNVRGPQQSVYTTMSSQVTLESSIILLTGTVEGIVWVVASVAHNGPWDGNGRPWLVTWGTLTLVHEPLFSFREEVLCIEGNKWCRNRIYTSDAHFRLSSHESLVIYDTSQPMVPWKISLHGYSRLHDVKRVLISTDVPHGQ